MLGHPGQLPYAAVVAQVVRAGCSGEVMVVLRIATFNVENLDETPSGARPSLAERVALMKPQVARLRADIACFQEVHGQERPGQPRALLALRELLGGTNLDGAGWSARSRTATRCTTSGTSSW